MTPEQMQRDQERDYAILERGVAALEARIAGLDQQLKAEILRQRTAEVRLHVGKELTPLAQAMDKRVKAARAMDRVCSPAAELWFARFHGDESVNATMQVATLMRFARTPTGELIEHLEDVAASNRLALAEAVRLEFMSRSDREPLKEAFSAAFAKLDRAARRPRSRPSARSRPCPGWGRSGFAQP